MRRLYLIYYTVGKWPDYALQIENLLEFYVVGVSLGTAWAHPSSGDTVASVMVGGLRTVQNGAFPIHTNDLICIYFDDERDFFEVILQGEMVVFRVGSFSPVFTHASFAGLL